MLVLVFTAAFSAVKAQSPLTKDGFEKYREKDFAGAIRLLNESNDPVDLRILGLSLDATGKRKDALSAFDRSFKNGYALFEESFEKWKGDPAKPSFLSALNGMADSVSASLASAESAFDLRSGTYYENEWRHKANILFNLNKIIKSGTEFYRSTETDTGVKLLTKPRPAISATNCVERFGLDVTVQLQVLFFPDGKTVIAIPTSKWRKNCSEWSVDAATRMTFESASKNGKAVGSIKLVEYSFQVR
ncbi:MAG: hypothetical protein K1X36_03550 [Pyrinomonadaceae bacterium]|nr:hypothetical protein [Pyrinomonadaceae bacterium]